MLYNNNGTHINMTPTIVTMLTLGTQAQEKHEHGKILTKGEMKNIQRRNNFLRPLREVLQQPDPNGRSCGGAFSIMVRARFVD